MKFTLKSCPSTTIDFGIVEYSVRIILNDVEFISSNQEIQCWRNSLTSRCTLRKDGPPTTFEFVFVFIIIMFTDVNFIASNQEYGRLTDA